MKEKEIDKLFKDSLKKSSKITDFYNELLEVQLGVMTDMLIDEMAENKAHTLRNWQRQKPTLEKFSRRFKNKMKLISSPI